MRRVWAQAKTMHVRGLETSVSMPCESDWLGLGPVQALVFSETKCFGDVTFAQTRLHQALSKG